MGASEKRRQKKIRQFVINRDKNICCYCSTILLSNEITLDHIVPASRRGTFNLTNLTVSCRSCNNKRGNISFFEYCKKFNFSEDKLNKYKKLYLSNLKIKVLNLSKEVCLKSEEVIPNELIRQACEILKIYTIDFSNYENIYQFEIKFSELAKRKKIKYCFEQLIKLIEAESC